MSRDEDDPDDGRTTDHPPGEEGGDPADGDPADDESAYPSYSWDGDEDEWRADTEPTTPPERSTDDRPAAGGGPPADDSHGPRRAERSPDDGRRPTDPPDDRRRGRQRRRRPDAQRAPGGDARRAGDRTAGEPASTADRTGWNFDSPHPDHGARRDEHERRRETTRAPPNRPDGDDGVKHIDWRQKGAFDFAFSYPTQRGWGPLLKAGAVVLVSPLLVFLPLVFLFGYVFRLTRYAAQGRTQPEFADYGDMLTDGVGYVVAFTLACAVWVGAVVAGAMLHDAVAVIFGLAGFYLFPAALTVYPVTGSITKTFSSSLTFDFAFSTHYLKYSLLYILLLVVLRIVASFSVLLFLVGVAWGSAFTYLANGAYWGFVYYRGAEEGVLPTAEEVDQRNGY
ncbi:DUF4013 domain-containing protein [Haloarchaeobius iranensis]|uniref:DUF4013 domain-containing protein n=1 Tax=Haloarchaeobius iranensis TaxID=996166 RepID=A0A1G9SJR2_9EURY|nr:DUF4013 domain-containing protein [Haloarchaeobius iranensis]SDM35736.1 Protein of unknown function [Haloarchaeobius iranensis]